jgi:YD repeat-containing protein
MSNPHEDDLPFVSGPHGAATVSTAQTCREVVRDASGRVVQTVERHKQAGGTVQAVTRDASGRITGTAVTRPNTGGGAHTEYRDASGRLAGSAHQRRQFRFVTHPIPRCLGPPLWQRNHQRRLARTCGRHPTRRFRTPDRQQFGERKMRDYRTGSDSAERHETVGTGGSAKSRPRNCQGLPTA